MAPRSKTRSTEGVLGDLPSAVRRLVPELSLLPATGEPRADCSACTMCEPAMAPGHPWAFNGETRCCTYHPKLPNYLVGQILARGNRGSETMRERLKDRSGVSAWGVKPSVSYKALERDFNLGFGRNPPTRCPFYVGGAASCSVWPDRSSVCRTWFCRFDDGVLAQQRWLALKEVLETLELRLGGECVADGDAPSADATDAEWEAWFIWCSEHATSLSETAVDAIAYPPLTQRRAHLAELLERSRPDVPDVVAPVLSDALVRGGAVYLRGHARYDFARVPEEVIHFFAALDGQRTWREVCGAANCAETITPQVVRELYRVDVLQAAPAGGAEQEEPGPIPAVLTPALNKPITVGDKVWLQGFQKTRSIVVPRVVFEFIALLDGAVAWTDALDIARRHGAESLNAALVERLYRIGVLVPAG